MARRKFTSEFKIKVAIAALSEQKSLSALVKEYKLAPAQISNWKQELKNNGAQVFLKGENQKFLIPDYAKTK
jgi:transposase